MKSQTKKATRSSISLLLAVCMLLSAVVIGFSSVSFSASAADEFLTADNSECTAIEFDIDMTVYVSKNPSGYKYYKLDDGTVEVSSYTGNASSVSVPSKIDGYTVTKIIGMGLNDNVTTITIPSTVTYISTSSFIWLDNFKDFIVDSSNANYSTKSGVLFNKNGSQIELYPNGRTAATYSIPSGTTSIARAAFYDSNKSLQTVIIPSSITEIADRSFAYSNITYMNIPNGVTTIGDGAFSSCDYLTYVNIPASVNKISETAFISLPSFTAINVDASNSTFCSYGGILFNKSCTSLLRYPEGKSGDSFTIPSSVNTVGEYAFYSTDKLYSVTVPSTVATICLYAFGYSSASVISLTNGLKTVANDAFWGCNASSLSIPDSVTKFGSFVFAYSKNLKSVKLPKNSSVTALPAGTFDGCKALRSVVVPANMVSAGNYAFSDCTSLKSVQFLSKNVSFGDNSKRVFDGCASDAIIFGIPGGTAESNTKLVGLKFVNMNNANANGITWNDYTEKYLYYSNNQIDLSYQGLANYFGTYYYVSDGQINWDYTGLTNFYGTWYYVENGVLNWSSAPTLTNFYGTWYYTANGILDWNYSSLVCYYGTWYNITNGAVDWNYTGLTNYYGTYYYVTNGSINWRSAPTLTKYYGTWYYTANGVLDWNYYGSCWYYGTRYNVRGGVVVF